MDRNRASAFDDPDVARAYASRPDYPHEMYELLVELAPHHDRALDLGCGTGKIAHGLAAHFRDVDAIDPSLPMLQVADDGRHPNITWIHTTAEQARLTHRYDLITAGASMHWMNHADLFPKLATLLASGAVIAVVEGDDVHDAAWAGEREAFLRRWVERLGGEFNQAAFRAAMDSYTTWMQVHGRRSFLRTVHQSRADFIECQHSRATWSRARLGPHLTREFDHDLRQTLEPFTLDDVITYTVNTRVVWGVPI